MENTKKNKIKDSLGKKGFYLLPNLFTTSALFAGFYSIVQAMNGNYDHAAMGIFVALIMDGLDGRVARLTNTVSDFGSEYDSLSDMVSFGVAPALVIYVWALQPLGKLGWIAAFIYCTCAAFRLARFNVKLDLDNKTHFFGLPSPAAATLLASFIWLSFDNGISGNEIFLGFFQMQWFAFILTIFAALSMTSDMSIHGSEKAGYRSSEGKLVTLQHRGSVEDTLIEIIGGVRSACTYIGAKRIKDMPKCSTFVRVNQQVNTVFDN